MDHDQRIAELFDTAIDLEPHERVAFLDVECAGQPALLAEIQALLASQADVDAKGFMSGSALELQAREAAAGRTEDTRSGEFFGRYQLLELIGEGGMGEVYLAEDTELHRQVAIKLIKSGLKTKEVLHRFHNEQQILANLQHPNIARLLDVGTTDDGLPFFVMEYAAGEPVDLFCDRHELTISERLKLFRRVCTGVQYAHQNLVVHRDLKPSNILVTKEGEPVLLDFGIAKLLASSEGSAETATLLRVLTPEYASPEQVKGGPITTASDVYSLGVLLYELLTGQKPYKVKGNSVEEIERVISTQEPERPSVAVRGRGDKETRRETNRQSAIGNRQLKGDLDNIVLMALRKEPQRRYASVGDFSEDIRHHLESLPVKARHDTFGYRTSKFIKRNKIGVAATAVILLTLIGGIIATAREAHVARAERANAEERFNDVRHLAHSVLFDYHDEIAALPGSTHVRERLVQDALQYLDRLSQKAGNDVSLWRELATAYLKVGDVQGRAYGANLGHTDQAFVSYQKALAILEQLLPHNSADKELQYDLATTYERIGNIQLRKGNWIAAQSETEKALAIREVLLAGDPQNLNYQRSLANCYVYLGDAMQAQCSDANCFHKALDVQRKGLAILENLARGNPSDLDLLREEALAYDRVAFRLSSLGQLTHEKAYFQQALESRQHAVAIIEGLVAAAPTNAIYRRSLADKYMTLGDTQIQNDLLAEGLNGYRQALNMFQALYSIDSANVEALRDLGNVHYKLAGGLVKSNDDARAREQYNQVLVIEQQLQAADPENPEDLQMMTAAYNALSDISEKEGKLDEAIADYRRVLDYYENRARIVRNGQASLQSWIANYYVRLARLYLKSGTLSNLRTSQRVERLRAAKAWYEKTIDLYRELVANGTLRVDVSWQNISDELAQVNQTLSNMRSKAFGHLPGHATRSIRYKAEGPGPSSPDGEPLSLPIISSGR